MTSISAVVSKGSRIVLLLTLDTATCRGVAWSLHDGIGREVASLGLVSPGAATEGFTTIFPKKRTTFLLITVTFIDFAGGCHPTPFLRVQSRLSTILCKFSHKKISFGCDNRGHSAILLMPLLLTVTTLQTWNGTD